MKLPLLLLALFLLCIPQTSDAQTIPIGGPFEEYLRILQHKITEGNTHSNNIRLPNQVRDCEKHAAKLKIQNSHPGHSFFTNESNQRFQLFTPTLITP